MRIAAGIKVNQLRQRAFEEQLICKSNIKIPRAISGISVDSSIIAL